MRVTALVAGGLACAGAAMTIAAFTGGGPDTPAQVASDGLDVWLQQGCGSCHTFKPGGSRGPIGPDLQVTLRGRSRDYVLESIVLPGKVVASGESGGAMPEDYAQRIAPQDLDPLVDFLMQGARQ